jgi:hypothetical protein
MSATVSEPDLTSAREILELYPQCAHAGIMRLITDVTADPPRAYVMCCSVTYAISLDELAILFENGYFGAAEAAYLASSGLVG